MSGEKILSKGLFEVNILYIIFIHLKETTTFHPLAAGLMKLFSKCNHPSSGYPAASYWLSQSIGIDVFFFLVCVIELYFCDLVIFSNLMQ